MLTTARAALLLTAFLGSAALLFPLEGSARTVRHEFDAKECAHCHPRIQGAEADTPPLLAERIDARCAKCHTPCDTWTMHGAGRNVPARMEEVLPLGASGTMECYTCHVTHVPPGREGRSPKLLRMTNVGRELCLNCHQERKAGRIAVVSPPPGVTVRMEELLLTGVAEVGEGEEVFVRLNGERYPLPVREGSFSTWLNLREGLNTLQIVHEDEVSWETEVYRASEDLAEGTVYLRLHRGHLTGRGECGDCHADMSGGYRGIASPTAAALCYRCHERFDGKHFIHGPVAVGACLSCHDPHGGIGESALVAEPSSLCLSCHARGDVRHCVTDPRSGAPTCIACHDPHESDVRFFTRGVRTRPVPVLP